MYHKHKYAQVPSKVDPSAHAVFVFVEQYIYVFKLVSKLSQTCKLDWEASKDM